MVETLPNTMLRVGLGNNHQVLVYLSGRMRKHHMRTLLGDKVLVQLLPTDCEHIESGANRLIYYGSSSLFWATCYLLELSFQHAPTFCAQTRSPELHLFHGKCTLKRRRCQPRQERSQPKTLRSSWELSWPFPSMN